jgi:hypothetical protein
MAKVNVSDQIMAPDKMKPILAFSKREPVQAAIALTATCVRSQRRRRR